MALEARLRQTADNEQTDMQRLRRMVAFDRLLARVVHGGQIQWVLKGGYAMELRMREARTTKDIDLTLREPMHLLNLTDISNPSGKGMFRTRTNQDLQRR